MRRKALPKHMRWRYRYLLVLWKGNTDAETIMKKLKEVLGVITYRSADARIIEAGSDYMVLRVRREYEWTFRAAFGLVLIPNTVIKVERVSGTIAALRRKTNCPINV